MLTKDVERVGKAGDIKEVSDGYGRNFLLPRGLAMAVSEANKAMIAKERKAHELRLAKEKAEFQAVADRIASLRYIAPRKVGENDVLYGSVTSGDIGDFLKGKGVEIDKRKVQLDEPIKQLGTYPVAVQIGRDVRVTVKVIVEASAEPE